MPSRTDPSRFAPPPAAGDQLKLAFESAHGATTGPSTGRSRRSFLLRHVFRADVDTCSRCGGSMRWLEAPTEQTAIARLLAKHGLAPQPPPAPPARESFGQFALPFG